MSQFKVIVWRPRGIYKLPETIGTANGNNEEEAVQNWIKQTYDGAELEMTLDDRGFWRLYDGAQLPVGEPFFLFEIEGGK